MFDYRNKIVRPIDWIKKPTEDLLKFVGSMVYWFFKPFCTKGIKLDSKYNRFLLIRRNRLGDAVNILPLIQLLRQQYPQAVIDVLSNTYNQYVFEASCAIDNIYTVPERHFKNRYLVCLHPEMKRLKKQEKYDFVIGATGAYSSATAWLALCSPGRNKVGVVSRKNQIMNLIYNIRVPQDSINQCKHQVDKIGFLAKYSDIVELDACMLSPRLDRLTHSPIKHSVALCPITNRKESNWNAENWELLAQLLNDSNIQYQWIGEKPKNSSGNIVFAKDTIEFIKLFTQFDIVICIEGGVSHIAPAIGCSTIAISGVNISESWIPWSDNSVLFEQTGMVCNIKPQHVMNQILLKINKNRFSEEDGAILNKQLSTIRANC